MSDGGVGAVEREALDRSRAAEVAWRQAYAARLERVAELGELGVAQQTGDRLTERLLQSVWHLDPAEASRLADEAADLCPRRSLQGEPLPPRMPATATVLAAGEIGPGHVRVIRRTLARLEKVEAVEATAWADAEQALAEAATTLPPSGLEKIAAQVLAALDPDGVAPDERDGAHDEVQLVTRRDGTLLMKAIIADAVSAEIVREGFDAGSTKASPDDDRTLAQRRAGALVEAFADARGPGGAFTDGPADAPPAPATPARSARRGALTITMDHRWLQLAIGHGTLESGALVDPRSARRWACDAEVVPIVLGSRSEPLDVGRMSRTVTDAIRRALNLRDGGCAFPGCTRRPGRCHAHHVEHWLDGGDTALENLALLCLFHHQLVHHGHWVVEMIDGISWFTPPPWVDPARRPRRGGRPTVPT